MAALTERDLLLADIAEARGEVDAVGLRRHRVYLRTRRWYAGTTGTWAPSGARGKGYPVDTEVEILPPPRVREVAVQMMVLSGGRFQMGDIKVDKITPRGELGVGIELWPFTQPTVDKDEERHVMLIERSGTPWHMREGTDRLLVAAPTNEASAVVVANALRAAYPAHWSDALAHAVDSTDGVGAPVATGFASARTLANALRAAWVAHRVDLVQHPMADAYPVQAPAATDDTSTLLLLHELLRVFNAHAAMGPVSECTVIEAHGDRAFSHSLVVRPTRRTP